jgi:hypothetical protein
MHIPTEAYRALRSLAGAAQVARDLVRVMSDIELCFFCHTFLRRHERMYLRMALIEVPDSERLYRWVQFRDDLPIMIALALHAREPETLQALADSMYCKMICRSLVKAGHEEQAKQIQALRRVDLSRTWDLEALPPERRRFGVPLKEDVTEKGPRSTRKPGARMRHLSRS